MPYTPDPAIVRRLATGLLDTARQEIDSTLIDEAITDHMLNGEDDDAQAALSAEDFAALQEAVGEAVRSAEMHITWPQVPAA